MTVVTKSTQDKQNLFSSFPFSSSHLTLKTKYWNIGIARLWHDLSWIMKKIKKTMEKINKLKQCYKMQLFIVAVDWPEILQFAHTAFLLSIAELERCMKNPFLRQNSKVLGTEIYPYKNKKTIIWKMDLLRH